MAQRTQSEIGVRSVAVPAARQVMPVGQYPSLQMRVQNPSGWHDADAQSLGPLQPSPSARDPVGAQKRVIGALVVSKSASQP